MQWPRPNAPKQWATFKICDVHLHPGCPPLCSALDLCSHGTQRQSLWAKLTTVSIATAFTQINSISRNSEILHFYTLHWRNKARSPTVPLHQPSWVINKSEPKTLFEAYLISSWNDIGKIVCEKDGSLWSCMLEYVLRTKFKMPITSRSRLSIASNSPYQHRGIPSMNFGALSPRRISDDRFSCHPWCHFFQW